MAQAHLRARWLSSVACAASFFAILSSVIRPQLVRSFTHAALSPDPDLAVAALMIARIEYPGARRRPVSRSARRHRHAKPGAGSRTRRRRPPTRRRDVDPDRYAQVMALNEYLFGELRFVGNEVHYEDPRNSFLNEVLDRRTGIPITLALLYMEVARRAGLPVEGVNFPGHFLLRCPARRGAAGRGRPHHRRVSRRRAAVATTLLRRRAEAQPDWHDGEDPALVDSPPAAARHQAADSRAHAAEPEARLRADAFVPAGARHHGAAARGRSRRRSTSCATAGCSRIT